jgi:Na+/H+-dicarboxylate symporter
MLCHNERQPRTFETSECAFFEEVAKPIWSLQSLFPAYFVIAGAALMPMIMFAIAFGVGLAAMKKTGHGDTWQVNAIDLILQQV